MKKRILSVLLALCLLVGVLPMGASAATNPYSPGQCTHTAWKAAYELAGVALPSWTGNAKTWYSHAKAAGYKILGPNDIPPAQSILCWDGNAGHVAYVVSANSSGATLIERYGGKSWNRETFTWQRLKSRGGGSGGGKLTLQGSFCLKGTKPSCPPHTQGSFLFYEAAHPHHNCYACSKCGKTIVDYSSSNKYKSCKECYPPDVIKGTASFSTSVKDITQTSATLDTNITANAAPSESGVYFGTSSGNLKKLSSDGASKSTTPHVWYSTSKYYGKLAAGTTYYYQFYTVVKGNTIKDSVRSFTTLQGGNNAKASFDSSAKDITKTSATMHAYVTASAVPSSGGMYFGTSTSNLKLLGSDTGLKSKTPHFWYATSKYYGILKPGVTYYYRPYVVISGTTVWGDIKTFQTAPCTSHVKGSFRFYEKDHPHKNYYACSVCGESFTDGSTSKMDACTTCNPPKIEITLFYDDGISDFAKSETKTGTTASQTFTIAGSIPKIDGYTFEGWSTSPNGDTVEYRSGATITISKDTTLYAVWKRSGTFKLSYYYYSGSQKNGYEEKTSEELPCRFIVRDSEETRKGYVFKGWSWNKNSTIPEYQPGDIVEIEENRTLYAVWESDGSISFEDVTVGEYYYDAVDWAVENNITKGTSDTKFSPNSTCTRAQAVTFLWRAAGSPEPTSTANPFTDVKSGEYYDKAVLWAVEKGITNGATKTTFNPNGKCIREQIVTFLYRADGSPAVTGGSFTDVAAGSYYENAVKWAVANEITNGTSATKFSPKNNCTRGQIVTFLYRYKN